jgi:hypothetical protein
VFKIFRKKRGKTMALNQETLEQLKGLSKEDKELLIKSLNEENVEPPKVEETDEVDEKPEEKPNQDGDKPKEETKQEETKVEEPNQDKTVEDKSKEEKTPPVESAWESALKKLQEDNDKKIKALEDELAIIKKRQPKGFEPQPNPKAEDLESETARRKKLTQNRW